MGQKEQRYLREMTTEQRERAARRARLRRRRRNQVYLARLVAFFIVVILFGSCFLLVRTVVRYATGDGRVGETVLAQDTEELSAQKNKRVFIKPQMTEDFLTPNEFSRPQEALLDVNAVFIHYTANAKTTAAQNRSYFEGLGDSGETSASSHFIIGFEGEIIQCLPLDEIGYAVKGRNYDSVSIECCYLDDSGKFTDATYQALIKLTAWLLGENDLTVDDVLRHYDEGGKNCPKYFVEDEGAWLRFKSDVAAYIEEFGVYDDGDAYSGDADVTQEPET